MEDWELPVWAIRPNWSESISETLGWMTSVAREESKGAEQRVGWRNVPRRTVEATYNPIGRERAFFDLALHTLGKHDWMVPLWFDCARLDAAALSGSSRLSFDTSGHEFASGDGMVLLVGEDHFDSVAVRTTGFDATGIDLLAPLDRDWIAGTRVHPLRRSQMDDVSGGNITSRVSEFRLRTVNVNGNGQGDAVGTWDQTHDGDAVLTRRPNWADTINVDLSFLEQRYDGGIGKPYSADTAGRAFRGHSYEYILAGKAEKWDFRLMLLRLRGQQVPIWTPTFADDIQIAASAAASATVLQIEGIGITYLGGPTAGRDRLYLPSGQIVQITDCALLGNGDEQLTLAEPLDASLSPGDTAHFVDIARLGHDDVEIEHLGDSEGAARCTLTFVNFADRRAATSLVGG